MHHDWRFRLPGALFALVLGLGYLTALFTLYQSHQDADLEPSLSVQDVVVAYHGDAYLSRLTRMSLGSMRKHYKAEEELQAVLAWMKSGAQEKDFASVKTVLEDRCERCHSEEGKASFAPMTTYAEVAKFTGPDTGMSLPRLANLSHQHLFGMGLLVFALSSLLFWQSQLSPGRKAWLTLMGFGGIVLDIGGWWGMKLHAGFVWSTLVGGALLGTFFLLIILILWGELVSALRRPPATSLR